MIGQSKLFTKEMYSLKFGEYLKTNTDQLTRIPGGWLFESSEIGMNSRAKTAVFIPYTNEFL